MNATHDAARHYHELGLPITLCPLGSKKPLGEGWSKNHAGRGWHKKEWTAQKIDRAFEVRGDLNVGVLFGPHSGIIDIECDSEEDRLAISRLFEQCPPRVTTGFCSPRGLHRLYAWDPDFEKIGKATTYFEGVEIKLGANGKGSHSLFPPSVTRGIDGNDVARVWLISLDDCPVEPLPELAKTRIIEASSGKSSSKAGVNREQGANTGLHRGHREHKQSLVSSVFSVCHSNGKAPLTPHKSAAAFSLPNNFARSDVEEVIVATVPQQPGQRHRAIFEFARHLKSIPDLVNAEVNTLHPYVQWWHESALPVITTKPFEETWFDFRNAWKSARYPAGEEPIAMIYAQALSKPTPECAEQYQQQRLKDLVALCRDLQQAAGSKPFFLAGRIAAEQIGVEHKTAARWLHMLCMDEVLVLVKQGTRHHASEYRYLGD